MHTSFILNELAEAHHDYFNAVAPPIVQTSNFLFDTVADMRKAFEAEYDTFIYSRGINPTVDILRKKLAALDNAEDCLVFNSGASAIFCAVLPFVQNGSHIVSVRSPYTWAKKMFDVILPRFGVTTTYIDGRDIAHWQAAMQPNTTLFYLESPNSWTFELQDLEAVAQLAKANHITSIIDNSYCTPLYQQPIAMGIDLSLQSATKYIGGHSDCVAGVLTGSRAHIEKIFYSEFMTTGAGATPFHAWLLLRGLRTLPMRLDWISKTTRQVLEFLKQHPLVEKVIFPLDPDFPQYTLAQRQMQGACGLMTFMLRVNNPAAIEHFCDSLKHVRMAVSWGGHESLIIPRVATMKPEDFDAANEIHRSCRLYVGLEEAGYLIEDLDQALTTCAAYNEG
jgi:cystathionine beta-lyase/cystathionine gamma-synthase